MSELQLGKIISGPAERDAIHVAVVPMRAATMLLPGQRVGIQPDGSAGPFATVSGVVDPFLQEPVPMGERFWLFLLPGTVTGMRHHWSHPAFDNLSVDPQSPAIGSKEYSERWLRDAADRLGVEYDTLVGEHSELTSGDYINNGEHIRDVWSELYDEFWKHREIVTGIEVPEGLRGGFTCSC